MRDGVITEADTCRDFVTPRLVEAGWGATPQAIGEQRSLRTHVAAPEARHAAIRQANVTLLPARLERLFVGSA